MGRQAGRTAGPVRHGDKASFDRLCDNLHPATGEPLTPRTNENRRVGYDLTFPGRNASASWPAGQPEDVGLQLRAIFDAAVEETLAEIEADMQTRVRKDGAQHDRPTGKMLWAGFDHSTSRPVAGEMPDPHRHRHVFCFNATETRWKRRIKAGEFGHINRDGAYYEAAFYSLAGQGPGDPGLRHRPPGRQDGKSPGCRNR